MSASQPSSSNSIPPSRSKLVIRRLPPTLPEEIFWKSVSTWITEETCLWKRYIKGRPGDLYNGHPVHSRAYCLMSTTEALVGCHRGFDGHVFRSKTGNEYQAVVEYSPVQKTPYRAKMKVDARQATIDDDPDYLSFLESLRAPPTKPILEVFVPAPQPTITPLIEHLRAAKSNKSQAKSVARLAQSSSTKDNPRSAALASLSKAAARRGPQAQDGPMMVAGKGREVTITPTSSTEIARPASGDGEKKKGKRGRGESPGRVSQMSNGPHASSSLASGASSVSFVTRASSPGGASEEGRGGGRGRQGHGGRGRRGRGGGDGDVRNVGGRGRGRGGTERSARGAVLQILSKNSESERGRERGGGRGGSRGDVGGGRGAASSDAGASEARIDM